MSNPVRHFYEFGPFRLDPEKHRLFRFGDLVPLAPRDVEALVVLVRHPGQLLEREELLQAVWADSCVEDANLTVAISHLRKALNQNGETAEYIETIPRVGVPPMKCPAEESLKIPVDGFRQSNKSETSTKSMSP